MPGNMSVKELVSLFVQKAETLSKWIYAMSGRELLRTNEQNLTQNGTATLADYSTGNRDHRTRR